MPKDREYTESNAPELAGFIELDGETIRKNHSLKEFSDLVLSCAA
uniref:Uncharacterized protein n=1 Tax=Candidatus Kentrum sp. TUN TaxID=2126343 RepID=A0A451A946_9GAMM|nr:MAG: hypothetical protein BECKTUN1418F_GA0071002_13111 [Candidatus Kentron sp. TUN]VFK71884.1 MAG: hypothetical protein BECKTUN1418E_GA0071001_13131 [Candidatus Kentron sp. TUN]